MLFHHSAGTVQYEWESEMRPRTTLAGIVIVTMFAAAAAYSIWQLRATAGSECGICSRPVHARSKAVGLVDGKRKVFCCPACALTTHVQTKKPVRVVELTDYESDSRMPPEGAFLVRGGNLNHCLSEATLVDSEKHALVRHFDRCSPGMVAFREEGAAREFAARHGGQVMKFGEFEAAYRQ